MGDHNVNILARRKRVLQLYQYLLFDFCEINAIEKIQVVACNILGSFLQLDCLKDKPMYLKFDGIMVDMLLEIDPTLKEHMISRGWYKMMYGKLNKIVYGTLLGTILFYEKLATQLHKWDFIMNKYDSCTWNKMVNGKQLTIQFLSMTCISAAWMEKLSMIWCMI